MRSVTTPSAGRTKEPSGSPPSLVRGPRFSDAIQICHSALADIMARTEDGAVPHYAMRLGKFSPPAAPRELTPYRRYCGGLLWIEDATCSAWGPSGRVAVTWDQFRILRHIVTTADYLTHDEIHEYWRGGLIFGGPRSNVRAMIHRIRPALLRAGVIGEIKTIIRQRPEPRGQLPSLVVWSYLS